MITKQEKHIWDLSVLKIKCLNADRILSQFYEIKENAALRSVQQSHAFSRALVLPPRTSQNTVDVLIRLNSDSIYNQASNQSSSIYIVFSS